MPYLLHFKIFNNSVETSLKFNREYVKVLNSKETENFSKRFNEISDALNCKFPTEGIRKNSNKLKVNAIVFNFSTKLLKKILHVN